jgi:hypothetical protein
MFRIFFCLSKIADLCFSDIALVNFKSSENVVLEKFIRDIGSSCSKSASDSIFFKVRNLVYFLK